MYWQLVFQVLYFKNVFQLFWNETLHLPVLQDSFTSSCSIALNIIPILSVVQVVSMTGIFPSVLQPSLHIGFTHWLSAQRLETLLVQPC